MESEWHRQLPGGSILSRIMIDAEKIGNALAMLTLAVPEIYRSPRFHLRLVAALLETGCDAIDVDTFVRGLPKRAATLPRLNLPPALKDGSRP